MSTLNEALRRLAELPEEEPRRPMFVVHPAHAENAEALAILRGMVANGVDVRVMPCDLAPAVPLNEWLVRRFGLSAFKRKD